MLYTDLFWSFWSFCFSVNPNTLILWTFKLQRLDRGALAWVVGQFFCCPKCLKQLPSNRDMWESPWTERKERGYSGRDNDTLALCRQPQRLKHEPALWLMTIMMRIMRVSGWPFAAPLHCRHGLPLCSEDVDEARPCQNNRRTSLLNVWPRRQPQSAARIYLRRSKKTPALDRTCVVVLHQIQSLTDTLRLVWGVLPPPEWSPQASSCHISSEWAAFMWAD